MSHFLCLDKQLGRPGGPEGGVYLLFPRSLIGFPPRVHPLLMQHPMCPLQAHPCPLQQLPAPATTPRREKEGSKQEKQRLPFPRSHLAPQATPSARIPWTPAIIPCPKYLPRQRVPFITIPNLLPSGNKPIIFFSLLQRQTGSQSKEGCAERQEKSLRRMI